ncbi:MAG: GAF domain-containing protein [Pseudohongiellaceae bacterium]
MHKFAPTGSPTNPERELKSRLRQQAALARLGQRALSDCDLQQLMDETARMVILALEADLSKILEVQPDRGSLLLRAGVGWREGLVGSALVDADRQSPGWYAMQSNEPVIVGNLRCETRFKPPQLLLDHDIISGLNVLVHIGGEPFAVLGAHTTRYRHFTDDDINFLQNAANILGMAIERERNEHVIRELSTPVLQIFPRVLLVPVVGRYDQQRAATVEDTVLHEIKARRAQVVVVDVTGAHFDPEASPLFIRTLKAAKLLGAEVLITGVTSELAGGLVSQVDRWQNLRTMGDLESGVQEALCLMREKTGAEPIGKLLHGGFHRRRDA